MTNIQSKIDLLKQRAIDLEAENAKLKQIIKENAKRKADNVNLSAENAKVKIELRRAMGENAKLKAESLQEIAYHFSRSHVVAPWGSMTHMRIHTQLLTKYEIAKPLI
ncbi:hypothetical protein Glove_349g164 [Diversispora epigaea]|uniref:Uncharacterized protein n=1 Tax=Diversispora epigaea TaxID=1348612 RepID=A0A397HIH8_9GLOM|nr:hypothetical protein Glove_349g164 [Diversispora epigaea]